MRVMLNGEARDLGDGLTVSDLVRDLGFNQQRIAVEVNRQIVGRNTYGSRPLRDGDVVEIVQFIGGG